MYRTPIQNCSDILRSLCLRQEILSICVLIFCINRLKKDIYAFASACTLYGPASTHSCATGLRRSLTFLPAATLAEDRWFRR
jgi:hypothetical protein